MKYVRRWLASPRLILLFTLIYVISQTLIARILHTGNADALLFQFQFCYHATAFSELLHSISASQLAALQAHFIYDHIHPVWYGLLALSLISWLLDINRLSARWTLLLWPVLLMPLLDLVENRLHEPWLLLQSAPSDPLVMIAGISATVKWGLAAACLLLAVVLGLRAAMLRLPLRAAG